MNAQESLEFLELIQAEREITRVIQLYCRASDRKDFELMRTAYHGDAYDDHGPFKGTINEFIEWGKVHHENFFQMMHLIGLPSIEIQGSVAYAETYCLLLQHKKVETSGTEAQHIRMAFRYLDRFERRAGQWKIARRCIAFEWINVDNETNDFAPFPIRDGYVVGKRSHDDPVYRLLAGVNL